MCLDVQYSVTDVYYQIIVVASMVVVDWMQSASITYPIDGNDYRTFMGSRTGRVSFPA